MAPDGAECTHEPAYDHVGPVPAALECPICRGTLEDPVQTPTCEHLYCRACLKRALDLAPSCPIDRIPLRSLDHCSPAPRAVRQLLDDLVVRCNKEGCAQEMPRDEWHSHQRDCPARNPGPEGDAAPEGEDPHAAPPDEHALNEKTERCELCSAELAAEAVEMHPSLCPAAHVPCAFCSLHLPRASHAAHLAHTCPSVPLPCPHAHRGCGFSAPRPAMDEHLGAECAYEPLAAYLDAQDARTLELEGENWALRARVARLEGTVAEVLGAVGALKAAMGEYCAPPPPPRASSPSPRARARSPPPTTPAPPSLPAALSALSSQQAFLSASLASLVHTQSQYAQHAQHSAEELAALRAQVAGVRMQLGGWMMQQRERELALASPGVGMGVGRPALGMRGRSGSDEGEYRDGDGSGSGSDEDGGALGGAYAVPLPGYAGGGAGMYAPPGAYFRRGVGVGPPLPPGMRFVPPSSLSPPGEFGSGGGGWLGDPMGMAMGVGLGYGEGGGGGRGRGVPIPMGGAGAVKL
ncbi:hypothetical protein JCM10449v2_004611 [Rhodotorula kratochvilovae]